MLGMFDFRERCEFLRPLIAVYTSHSAHESAQKNELDFAQILLPFSKVMIQIKDPITQHQHEHELRLDLRDLRRDGFLLSHTVFRFVLQESILSSNGISSALTKEKDGTCIDSILSNSFYQTFLHWLEPSEHEFLRTYLACIFVVSTADSDPLNKLAELQAEQHWEQHNEGNAPAKSMPAYCVPPKWFFPNILKYFVLLHDNSLPDLHKQRSEELFNAVCERYGKKFCSFVYLNSANPDSIRMPDIWGSIVMNNQKNLQAGLAVAKKNLYSINDWKTKDQGNITNFPLQQQEQSVTLLSVSSAPSISYQDEASAAQSSFLFTSNSCLNQADQNEHFLTGTSFTYAQVVSGTSNVDDSSLIEKLPMKTGENICKQNDGLTDKIYGQCLSDEDRMGLKKLVENFVQEALVPFVEKHLSDQNEFVLNRRSLARNTFSSMKKWLQNATTTNSTLSSFDNVNQMNQSHSNLNIHSNSINNTVESVEYQARRLADLALLFGLYQYANQLYQYLKKEFASNQAWLYHVGCLEMAGISAFLQGFQQYSQQLVNQTLRPFALANLRKLYPQRYLNNAILSRQNLGQPYLALRSLMNSVLILTQLELYSEAAQQLINFSAPELMDLSDLIGAVLLEHSARIFTEAGNRRRKSAFYLVNAGTHVLKFTSKHKISEEILRRSKCLSHRLYSEVYSSSFTGKGWTWADKFLLQQYTSCL